MLPLSVQTTEDVLANESFDSMKEPIKDQEIPHKTLLNMIYKKMEGPSQKAMEAYHKYLEEKISEQIKKHLEDYNVSEYYASNYYVKAGVEHVLRGNESHYEQLSQANEDLMEHHSPASSLLHSNENRLNKPIIFIGML